MSKIRNSFENCSGKEMRLYTQFYFVASDDVTDEVEFCRKYGSYQVIKDDHILEMRIRKIKQKKGKSKGLKITF